MADKKKIRLKVLRQDGPTKSDSKRWEEFDVDWHPQMNVISALMEIQKHPHTPTGRRSRRSSGSPSCLEEVCGSCTMLVNGKVRQACSALIDQISPEGEPITLAPMTKFPLVRDLVVDRSRMFQDLKKVKAWIHLDGSHELGPGPAPVAGEPGRGVSALALHDVRLLHGGMPAGERRTRASSDRRRSAWCGSSTCIRAGRCTRASASRR